ncbi:MAG: polyprenol monophosphomannose synthase [Planctomycetes bacterium]|nr:polyprenol monophosphomannose synthase [Planctomycetota bacterium]
MPRPSPTTDLVVCTVPTYTEAENILPLARELLALGPQFVVLVIDDHSPDGTWRLVEEAAKSEPRLHLLHRTTDKGRGRAGRDGFVRALELGASTVIEMDADHSHQPRYIPVMIERLNRRGEQVGLVLGSRGVLGGRDAHRGLFRQLLTRCANLYIRMMLGVTVRDCNSGFRCWRAETLRAIDVAKTFSPGPAIVQELLFKTAQRKIGIAEVPIEFHNRLHGQSTLTLRILLQGYTAVLKLRWLALTGRI